MDHKMGSPILENLSQHYIATHTHSAHVAPSLWET